jgi:putative transcriptional regulator
MNNRNLFAEIAEGFEALAEERAGERTLRTHEVEVKPAPEVTAAELITIRERLHLSRPVLAR